MDFANRLNCMLVAHIMPGHEGLAGYSPVHKHYNYLDVITTIKH